MAATYPGALDTGLVTTRVSGNTIPASDHNDLADAVQKIEAELGTSPRGAFADVKARLAAAFSATVTQTAAGANQPVFSVVPAVATAPFQVEMKSFANTGAGAGTWNDGVWLGWNAARFSGGTPTAAKPGLYMGFEDNYHDTPGPDVGEEKYGMEWYVGYTTPDGTTIAPAGLRPFYMRVKGSRTNTAATAKSVQTWIDVGGGATGFFSIMHGQVAGNEIATFTKDAAYIRKQTQFTNNGVGLEVRPNDAAQVYAQLNVNCQLAAGFSGVHFKTADVGRWTLVGSLADFYVEDVQNSGRKHIQMLPASTSAVASTILKSNLTVEGRLLGGTGVQSRTADFTLAATDIGALSRVDSTSARIVTFPDETVAIPVGSSGEIARWGVGTVTLARATGVLIRNSVDFAGTTSRTITPQGGTVGWIKIATNEFFLTGSLA